MSKVREFYGVSIHFYREHPPPHFHPIYGEHQALIEIETSRVLQGPLPRRALGLVREWASQHQDELRRAWAQARNHEPVDPIDPLPCGGWCAR